MKDNDALAKAYIAITENVNDSRQAIEQEDMPDWVKRKEQRDLINQNPEIPESETPEDADLEEEETNISDTTRLEWLANQGFCWRDADKIYPEWVIPPRTEWLYSNVSEWREMIDSAMQEDKVF